MKIGDIVRIKEEYSDNLWYHNNNMTIVGIFNYSFNNEFIYKTDSKYDINKHFSEKYLYNVLDERKKKLDSL